MLATSVIWLPLGNVTVADMFLPASYVAAVSLIATAIFRFLYEIES